MPLKNYSSGMQARIGFAIATMDCPDILIVDEVLSVGDFKFREKCNQRMSEMLQSGTTLLLVSHSIEDIRNMCTKALWLEHGTVKMTGDVIEVTDAYTRGE